jgi:hypothetical protein
MIEKIDETHYSNVIRLQNSKEKFSYKVYRYPEMSKYHLTCTSLNNNEKISINIISAQGNVIMDKDFGKISKQLDYDIDLSGKSGGVYFLNIRTSNNNYTVKLLAN